MNNQFYHYWNSLLNILEYKNKNLKVVYNKYLQYVNDLNNQFEQHQTECENLKKDPMDEETKLLYSLIELEKIRINSPSIYNFKNFNDLIDELYRRHDFFEKANLLKYSNYIPSDYNINNIKRFKILIKIQIENITVITENQRSFYRFL